MSKFVNSTINNFNKKFIKISISQNNPNQLLFCFFKNINSNKDFIKSNAMLFLFYDNFESSFNLINSFWHGIAILNKLIYIYFKHYNNYDVILPHISKNHFYYKYINIFIPENKILILNYKRKYEFNNIITSENIYHNYSPKPSLIIKNKNYHTELNFSINKLKHIILNDNNFNNTKTYDKIFIYRSSKNTLFENNRIFHNYEFVIDIIKTKYPDILILEPNSISLKHQIFLMMNCNLLINDWGSALSNNLWLKPKSNVLCLIHPWMAYFGDNQQNSGYVQDFKHLKLNFIPIYSKLYHNDILLNTKFIQREKTKDSFNGNLDISYKFLIDDSKFFSILDKFYHN